MKFARRLDDVQISTIRQIMERAGGCVNLALGEPHFFAPQVVREEAHRVLEEEKIGYSPNPGFMDLRQAVLRYHGNPNGHSVCVTNGSQEALFDVLLTLAGGWGGPAVLPTLSIRLQLCTSTRPLVPPRFLRRRLCKCLHRRDTGRLNGAARN
ncbi:MAG: hypothetical protein ACRD1R_13725 [Acidobacteriota bacterium]